MFMWCSISPQRIEGFLWNFGQMFIIPRWCAAHNITEVKVTIQESLNGNVLCPLYNFKIFKISSWNFVQI